MGGTTKAAKAPTSAASPTVAERRLSRDEIVGVARRLLAEDGVDRLTMRRLADACGVQGPALYWHFTDKDDLLGRIVESVIGDLDVGAEGQPWADRLLVVGRSLRCLLVAHPGLAVVSAGRYTVTEAVQDGFDDIIRVLAAAGFTHRQALAIFFGVVTFTTGFVTFETSSPFFALAATEPGSPERAESLARYAPMDGPAHPDLAQAVHALPDLTVDELFEQSLGALVAGWAVRLGPA